MGRDTHRDARVRLHRLAVAAVAAAALLLPATIGADPGFVPGKHGVAGEVLSNHQRKDAGQAGSAGNLTYHGGPVIHQNTTYTIFWGSIDSGYQSTINKFFGDVAQDSGGTGNVYSTDSQYTDPGGAAAYNSSFAGTNTWNDTSTPVPDNCSGEYAGTGATVSGCVLDSDIQAEVSRAMAANGWTGGLNHIFFVFTPKNVGSCTDSTSKECAYTYYCAYHWYFTQSGTPIVYANQPYTDTSGVGNLYTHACDSGQQPNGNWADSTINVASHEHNEAVTDPEGNAWYDSQGNEDGDKCAWNFGAALGGNPGSQWNQVINGDHYYLQQEWNNASSGCVLNTTPPPPPPAQPTISGFSPAGGGVGAQVVITGQNLAGANSVKFHGTSASFTADPTGASITTNVPSGATTGSITVTTAAGTATSGTFTVTPPPAPDFSVGASSPTLTMRRGSNTTDVVTVTETNGVAGSVNLTVTGLPNAANARFTPSTVTSSTAGVQSTLTISTRPNTRVGTYKLTVTGTSGTVTRTTTVSLTVQ
jgi:VCBS repeat-containing protein